MKLIKGNANRLRVVVLVSLSIFATSFCFAATTKQQSLDRWRHLTASNAPPPNVFVKGDQARFFFQHDNKVDAFIGHWSRGRVPSEGYRVASGRLHWDEKLSREPKGERGWRQATVIAGADWRRLSTNLLTQLTPGEPGHAAYYQSFLANGMVYRDAQGMPRFAPLGQQPKDVVLDRRFSDEETLQALARLIESYLVKRHPGDELFVVMAPDASRFGRPIILDRKQHRCISLSPAALFDPEKGLGLVVSPKTLGSILFESHGIALLKNPISSAARLLDLGVQTFVRFVRFPWPKPSNDNPPLTNAPGMDLDKWEAWLNHYTGTQIEEGSLKLLIDGDHFFPRLFQGIAEATNHLNFNIYIFDADDVAVNVANRLKARAAGIDVRVLMDRLGSLGAAMNPPSTAMPEDFVAPASISAYLRENSHVHVRKFLNPWFSSDHTKVFLMDGVRGWLGGMNFGREYLYEWHDTMVELEGPVVTTLEQEFRRNWAHAGSFGDLAYAVSVLTEPPENPRYPGTNHWSKLRLLPTRTGWKPFSSAVLASIRRAKNYVYLENPYLFDKRVILALAQARQRGVDVRVIMPRINDFKAAGRSNLVIANYLLEHGVRIYFYPAMTHVKALLVDGWSCVGSANMNHLSLRVNQEQNVATSDADFASVVRRELFEEDFNRSYELKEPISVDWVDFLADLVLEGL